jgi:hydroxymethylpyrimidine pyrophosphatase-like HAD family hydrolase
MDETMAFGDTQNDEAMLKHARLGYAMKNAEQEALDATDLITPLDNNDSGVLDMIDRVLSGEVK